MDAAELLGFAGVDGADLEITAAGREIAAADILASKELFAQHAYERAPLVRAICNALAATTDGNLDERFFLDLLRRSFSAQDAQHELELAIDWAATASSTNTTPTRPTIRERDRVRQPTTGP